MRQIIPIYSKSDFRKDIIQKLWNKPHFKTEIKKFRKKWKIDTAQEFELWMHCKEPSLQFELLDDMDFLNDLKKLQKRFNLGEQWSCYMKEFIFIDTLEYGKTSNFFIERGLEEDADSIIDKPSYYIRIFPETTQEDIIKSWKEINEFIHESKHKPKRQKLSKNINRDQKIYELAKSGQCVEDIHNVLIKETGKSVDYDAIRTAEGRYRKKMGIKQTNKLGYRKNK